MTMPAFLRFVDFSKQDLLDAGDTLSGKLRSVKAIRNFFNIFSLLQAKIIVEAVVELSFNKTFEEVDSIVKNNKEINDYEAIVKTIPFHQINIGGSFISLRPNSDDMLFIKISDYSGMKRNGEVVSFDNYRRVLPVE